MFSIRKPRRNQRFARRLSALACEKLEDRLLLAVDFLPGDSVISPSVGSQKFVAVEEGGNGYLAVWTDERTVLSGFVNSSDALSGNKQDIYGQLLDLSGQPVGEPIIVTNMGQNQLKPDIAWNESAQAWLVVFESQDPDWYFDHHVYGVRVAANGDVLDPEPIRLFEQVGNQGYSDADVASDGQHWTIIADSFSGSPLRGTIFGRRMAADGSLPEFQPTLIVQSDLVFPDIEFADNVYMIAAKERVTDRVHVGRIDTQLNPVGNFALVGGGTYAGPTLASNGSQFLVVGDRAHRFTTTGQNLDPAGIPLGGSTTGEVRGDADWSGSMWIVGMRAPVNSVGFQRISDAGVLLDTQPVVVTTDVLQEAVAVAGSETGDAVIAFPYRPANDQNMAFVVAHEDATFTARQDLAVGLSRQAWVNSVDGPGSENLVVYVSQTASVNRIFSQRVTDEGVILDAEPTLIVSSGSGSSLGNPKVAWNGSVYLVAWNNVAVRVSADNQVLDSQPIVVSNLPVGDVTTAGDTFIVGLYEYISFHEPVQYAAFVRMSGGGVVLDSTPIRVAFGFVRSMTAATFGDTAILAWSQYNQHHINFGRTQAVLINADGSHGSAFTVSNELGTSPDIAVQGNQALFVYMGDVSTNQGGIEGRFVMADGSMPQWEFTISDGKNARIYPDVAWTGTEYVVAWNDYRHLEGIQQQRANIRAVRVLADGTVREPNGFTVTSSALPEDLSTVVGGSGNSWILFSALNGVGGVPETQRIGYQFGPIVDYVAAPLARTGTQGAQTLASSGNLGLLAFADETHRYDLKLRAGERVSAIITPSDPSITLSAGFDGLTSMILAPAPGAAVIVPLTNVPSSGDVTLSISGDGQTAYEFEVHQGVNLLSLIETGGSVAIDDSRIDFGDSGRFAAEGLSSGQVGGTGFDHYNDPSLFVDISTTGTQLVLDDGFYGKRAYVTTTVGNDVFPAGSVTIAKDGALVAGLHDIYLGAHQPLPDYNYIGDTAALAPFWSILGANTPPSFTGAGKVYMEERVVNGIDTLIVQWNNIPAWSNVGAATFQVQVFATGPVQARFVYPDITFGDPNLDGGGNASIGVQFNRYTAYQFSFNTSSLSDGDVVDFTDLPTIEDSDDMTVDLAAGDVIDVALLGRDASFAGQSLELLDEAGMVLATGSATWAGEPIANYDQAVFGYEVPVSGTYTVRVTSQLEARYSLVVTQRITLDTEPNNDGSLRSITNTKGALGYLEPLTALAGYSHYNDPSRFIDISQTGTALFFDHGDGIRDWHTTIGNALMPAGKFLVGTDGVLMQNEDIAAFSGYSNPPIPNTYFEFSALVPFWSDLEDDTGNIYVEERVVDGVDTLIVQWDDRSYFFQSGTGTFQVQLFDRDPGAGRQLAARYVYQDVDFNNALYDNGNAATVGLQLTQNTAALVSSHTPSIANGDVIEFYIISGDRYELDLTAGETVILQTSTPWSQPGASPVNTLDPAISVLDASGAVLATDLNSADGKNAELIFTAPATGTYTVSVFAEASEGEYVLHRRAGASTIDGDFDNDGSYGLSDIDALVAEIASATHNPLFDLTGDGLVDLADRDAWLAEAAAVNYGQGYVYLLGDANLDGIVDGVDFTIWNANKFTSRAAWSAGDFNADGLVDGVDFSIWNANKFTSMLPPAITVAKRTKLIEARHLDAVFAWNEEASALI